MFSSTSTIWLFIVSKLKEENKFKLLKIESTKFKRNYTVFKSLLNKSKPINANIIDTNEIVFGNANAPLQLLVVTNPFCGFCRDVHNLVENILKKYSEQISITIRFNINTNNEKNELAKITTRLFEIYHEKGEQSCLEAMHHIYNKRDIIDWFNLFGSSNNVLQYRNVLLKEKKWCVENQINFTPALLVNGLVYPKEYKNEDLLFFVDDLFEDTINANYNNLELEIA